MTRGRGHYLNRRRGLILPPARVFGSTDGALSAVTEIIQISDHQGELNIDITGIGTPIVGISDFNRIEVYFKVATSQNAGTGVKKGVQLSIDGGLSFIATGYAQQLPGNFQNQTMVLCAESAATWTSWCSLINLNEADIPVHYMSVYDGVAQNMSRVDGTMAVVDALRFAVTSTGSSVQWGATGTIEIAGYR